MLLTSSPLALDSRWRDVDQMWNRARGYVGARRPDPIQCLYVYHASFAWRLAEDFSSRRLQVFGGLEQCRLYPIFQGVCYVVPDPFDMRDVVDRNTPHSGAMVMCQKNTRTSCLLI